jgi:hypothetical protein
MGQVHDLHRPVRLAEILQGKITAPCRPASSATNPARSARVWSPMARFARPPVAGLDPAINQQGTIHMTQSTQTPAPSLFQNIIAWGRHELAIIEGEAETLWDTIEPALVAEAENAVGQFLGAAIAAVKAQAALVLSGEEKFSNAKDALLETVEASGQTIGNTLLEFLINLALSLLKIGSAASLV